jgi:hypothetical protein
MMYQGNNGAKMKSEHKLLRSQKNEVLEAIKSSGLDPFNFKWSEDDSQCMMDDDFSRASVERLSYEDLIFYFQFDYLQGKRYAIFSSGRERCVEEQSTGAWTGQLTYVRNWLTYLKRELAQPDLWDELFKYQLPPGAKLTADIGNEPFTVKEAEQLSEGIRKVRAYID